MMKKGNCIPIIYDLDGNTGLFKELKSVITNRKLTCIQNYLCLVFVCYGNFILSFAKAVDQYA